MSAAAAYTASVPLGTTLILGEWQHGCSASIAAKTDVLRALAYAGHRVRVLVEARAEDVANLIAAQGRGRAETALGCMPHVYRSREFLELIELEGHQSRITFSGYDFRFGSARSVPICILEGYGFPAHARSQLSVALEATLRPWESWAQAALHAISSSLLDEMQKADLTMRECAANVRYAQLLARPSSGLGLTKNKRPRVARAGALAAFNFRDTWCANRIMAILTENTMTPGAEPVTTIVWCAAVHGARSLTSVARPADARLLVSLAQQLRERGLTFVSLATTAKSGEYLDTFRLEAVPVPVGAGWLENRLPTGEWLAPKTKAEDAERAAFLGACAEAEWSRIYDRVYVARSTQPISLVGASNP